MRYRQGHCTSNYFRDVDELRVNIDYTFVLFRVSDAPTPRGIEGAWYEVRQALSRYPVPGSPWIVKPVLPWLSGGYRDR